MLCESRAVRQGGVSSILDDSDTNIGGSRTKRDGAKRGTLACDLQ